jgi:hypothetical protein
MIRDRSTDGQFRVNCKIRDSQAGISWICSELKVIKGPSNV